MILSRSTRRAARRRLPKIRCPERPILVQPQQETVDDRTAHAPMPAVCNLKCSAQHRSPLPWCHTRSGHHTDAKHVGATIHSASDGKDLKKFRRLRRVLHWRLSVINVALVRAGRRNCPPSRSERWSAMCSPRLVLKLRSTPFML